MRCVVPRTLPSSSTAAVFFGFLLVLGAIFWIAGGRLARRAGKVAAIASPPVTWTRAIVDNDERVDAATRLDMIERLAIVGEPWCVTVLNDALAQERDETLRDAADRALLVIAARG